MHRDGAAHGEQLALPFAAPEADNLDRVAPPFDVQHLGVLVPSRFAHTLSTIARLDLVACAVARHVLDDAALIIVLLPTESDCRGIMVDDIEPLFASLSEAGQHHMPRSDPERQQERAD